MRSSHSPYAGQSINSSAAYAPDPLLLLLQAAAEFMGGQKQSAERLGVAGYGYG